MQHGYGWLACLRLLSVFLFLNVVSLVCMHSVCVCVCNANSKNQNVFMSIMFIEKTEKVGSKVVIK
jgi:hypothetical protein